MTQRKRKSLKMVRLAVPSPDSPPLSTHSSSNNLNANTNSFAPQSQQNEQQSINQSVSPQPTPPPAPPQSQSMQMSPQQTPQMAPPQQQPPLMTQMHPMHHHHMHQHPQHNNGHHHNGLYLPAYGNEYYPGATDQHGHTAYLIPPEYCPTHAPMCTMHSDYGKRFLLFCFVPFCINLLSRFRFGFGTWIWVLKMVVFNGFFVF